MKLLLFVSMNGKLHFTHSENLIADPRFYLNVFGHNMKQDGICPVSTKCPVFYYHAP